MISHARRVSWEPRSLFPGYLFVRFDPDEDRWQDVQRLSGAVAFVRFGRHPSSIDDNAILAIRRATDEGVFNDSFEVGDKVKVSDGPFAGMLGKIADLNADRAIIELLQCASARFTCKRDMISAIV
jgi:transcriptional antiterminator RfaH